MSNYFEVPVGDEQEIDTVLAGEVQVGDIVEVVEGEKILVKTVRRVGSFVQFTAFGHPSSDRWYVHPAVALVKGKMTFEVEQSNWEYVRTFVQLPLPFPQGVL